tara:strand:+ start:5702 stop:6172 length:471 start_codon:yes stop_codon:yes gene_type:complete
MSHLKAIQFVGIVGRRGKMRPLVKRIDMALHIQELCAVNHITVSYQSLDDDIPNYYANPRKKHIHIRPTKNTGYYVSALHEIGHILGDDQTYNNTVKEREIGAWIWAMLNAKVWTDTADRVMASALSSYGVTLEESTEIQQRWNPCHRDDEEQIAV